MSISNSKRFYWHGIRVTEIVYKQRVAQSKYGANIAVNRGNCAKRKAAKNEKKKRKSVKGLYSLEKEDELWNFNILGNKCGVLLAKNVYHSNTSKMNNAEVLVQFCTYDVINVS